ncbi:MAG: hypothetical protein H6707_01945 [Deltaproteobacteria bacterium]|nr:hypothetical protein [Deltaproteobacteria bacterium]
MRPQPLLLMTLVALMLTDAQAYERPLPLAGEARTAAVQTLKSRQHSFARTAQNKSLSPTLKKALTAIDSAVKALIKRCGGFAAAKEITEDRASMLGHEVTSTFAAPNVTFYSYEEKAKGVHDQRLSLSSGFALDVELYKFSGNGMRKTVGFKAKLPAREPATSKERKIAQLQGDEHGRFIPPTVELSQTFVNQRRHRSNVIRPRSVRTSNKITHTRLVSAASKQLTARTPNVKLKSHQAALAAVLSFLEAKASEPITRTARRRINQVLRQVRGKIASKRLSGSLDTLFSSRVSRRINAELSNGDALKATITADQLGTTVALEIGQRNGTTTVLSLGERGAITHTIKTRQAFAKGLGWHTVTFEENRRTEISGGLLGRVFGNYIAGNTTYSIETTIERPLTRGDLP